MSQIEDETSVIECPECNVEKEVAAANEGLDFYRRHRKLTGHDVEWQRTSVQFDDQTAAEGDLKELMWELDERYDDGVPIGVVTAVRSERGTPIRQTLEDIDDLRMSGGLYEPRDDHLSPF